MMNICKTYKVAYDIDKDGCLDEKEYIPKKKEDRIRHQICTFKSDKEGYDRMHIDSYPKKAYYNKIYVKDGYERKYTYEQTAIILIPLFLCNPK